MATTWTEQSRFQPEAPIDDSPKQPSTLRQYLESPVFKIVILFIVLAATVPTLVYFFVVDLTYDPKVIQHTCMIEESYRISCGKINITEQDCSGINCCYNIKTNSCYHFLPSKYNYYSVKLDNGDGYSSSQVFTPYRERIYSSINISIVEETENKLRVVLHSPDITIAQNNISQKNYVWKRYDQYLGIEVFKNKQDQAIFSTIVGPLMASQTYWEWTVNLNAQYLFGLGELLLNSTKTIVKVIYNNKDEHTTLPVFMAYNNMSQFYGFYFECDGPVEVQVLPSKMVVFRSLGGMEMNMVVLMGPTPRDIRQQITGDIPLPPYWVLGPHICREGITDFNKAKQEFIKFSNINTIKYESDCFHENTFLMSNKVDDSTAILDVIDFLKSKTNFMLSMPPQVFTNGTLYSEAESLGILYKINKTEIFKGEYNGYPVVYPDFKHVSIGNWIDKLLSTDIFKKNDGLILTDSWPKEDNFIMTPQVAFSYLPTNIRELMSYTIPWDASDVNQNLHYLTHNAYGRLYDKAVQNKSIPLMLSSTNVVNSPVGLLIQNVELSWTNLRKTLLLTLQHSMFGKPLVSVPVCGSTSKYNRNFESLCIRWYIMAATLPYFRVSSVLPRRDHSNLLTNHAKYHAAKAISIRETMQPYFYTLLSENEIITRPMFYNFYSDYATFGLENQYMVGNNFLVVQPFTENTRIVQFYLPTSIDIWYEFQSGTAYKAGVSNMTVVETDWIMFIPARTITPLASDAGQNKLTLQIALDSACTGACARGSFYVDDTYLNFVVDSNILYFSDILDVKKRLKCTGNVKQLGSYIDRLKIYTIQNKITFKDIDLDICEVLTNNYNITLI